MALTVKQVKELISEAIMDYAESQHLTFGEAGKLMEGLQEILNESFVQAMCCDRIQGKPCCKVLPNTLRNMAQTICRAYHAGVNVGYQQRNVEDQANGYYG